MIIWFWYADSLCAMADGRFSEDPGQTSARLNFEINAEMENKYTYAAIFGARGMILKSPRTGSRYLSACQASRIGRHPAKTWRSQCRNCRQ
jgi:hypothetical protein